MPPRGKCPEASQLYTVPLSESSDDLLKDGIDDLLDISFVEMRIPSHEAQYQLGLDHGGPQVKVTVVYGPNLGPKRNITGRDVVLRQHPMERQKGPKHRPNARRCNSLLIFQGVICLVV